MRLIAVYCILVAIGEVITFFLGLIVERLVPSFSMLIYMLMFFGVLWLAKFLVLDKVMWRLADRGLHHRTLADVG